MSAYLFHECPRLSRAFFHGDAPLFWQPAFFQSAATVFYLPGTKGWTADPGGVSMVLWNPEILTEDGRFGILGEKFGFSISGTPGIPVSIEASNDLTSATWTTIATLILEADGTTDFRDPATVAHAARLYRIRME